MKRTTPLAALLALSLALPLRADAPPQKPVTVPFELFPTKHIAIKIKVNGKGPYRVIFDTGSPVTLLSNKVADEAKLLGRNRPQAGFFNPFGAGGEAKVKELELGGLKLTTVPVIVMDHPGVKAMSDAFGPVEGIVGFPVFARFKMTLDYKDKTLTFAPSKYQPTDALQGVVASILAPPDGQAKPVAPAGQWGLTVRKAAGDDAAGVTIGKVLAGSAAAAAGLKPGDRLLTLDGRWTDSVIDAYLAASYVKAGASVTVTVRRDGKELELTVKPAAGL
jgi:hypothetical protein